MLLTLLATPVLSKRAPTRKLPPTAWSRGLMIASPTCHGLRDVIGKPAPKRSLGIRAIGLLAGAHAQSIARRLEARPSRAICQDNGAPSRGTHHHTQLRS